ncbi:MAG: hypothetical protein SFV15_25255 [Polyangiaceae bacterium]|nr:hypothetical protein [Polyangiaceae bacterium]
MLPRVTSHLSLTTDPKWKLGFARLLLAVAPIACSKAREASPGPPIQAAKASVAYDPTRKLPAQTCKLFMNVRSPSAKLSQTGCVDPKNPKAAAPSLIPYDVNSPLWSDGATKGRFIALPENAKIRVKDCKKTPNACAPGTGKPSVDGDWELPVGTVLMKTFELAGRLIETRLLMRFGETSWAGYSYAWNAEQTDAEVLPDALVGVDRSFPTPAGNQIWHFPSRSECFQCHTEPAGVSLGLETAQLDRGFTYATGHIENQLEVLARHAAFQTWPLPSRPTPYPNPSNTQAPLEARARSYLHANCAVCHTPGGRFDSLDLRFTTEFPKTGLCNAEPHAHGGTLGVPGALVLVPQKPTLSILSLRMHALPGAYRMPPIASALVDPVGVELIDAWIVSRQNCM